MPSPKCVSSNTFYTTIPPSYYTGSVIGPNRMTCKVYCPKCGRMFKSSGAINGPRYCIARVPKHVVKVQA